MQIVAILRVSANATAEEQAKHRRTEAQAVWGLLASGVLRSIHFHDGPGALLLLETPSRKDAERQIAELPMVRANLVDAELLSLKPFTGLEDLFDKKAAP